MGDSNDHHEKKVFDEDLLSKPIEDPVTIVGCSKTCLCPCPIGMEAIITVKKFPFTFIEDYKVVAGDTTGIRKEHPKGEFGLPYDFHNKDMGIINNLTLNVTYKLTFFYKVEPPSECCEKGIIKFNGDVTFNGESLPFSLFASNVMIKDAKAQLNTSKEFNFCEKEDEKEQCNVLFKGQLNKDFYPTFPRWNNPSFKVKGIFSIDVKTKKKK
jgi:hypothetical protein